MTAKVVLLDDSADKREGKESVDFTVTFVGWLFLEGNWSSRISLALGYKLSETRQ